MYIIEVAMQISKWGNSLAVRLPKEMVDRLGLKEGEKVEVTVERLEDIERQKRLKVLKRLRKYRGMMPERFKFNREEAHERD
jgi:antitoxin MazE